MAFKFVIISCLVALVRAGNVPAAIVAEPVVVAEAQARLEEFDLSPNYSFGYEVGDTNTGDFKSQNEQRNGDLVQGRYAFIQPDGLERIVDYTADSVNGFNAIVRTVPVSNGAPVAAAPVAVAPAPTRLVAPAAPVFAPAPYTAYPAPLARYAYQPFARFTAAAPFAYRGAAAQVVAV